IGGVLARRTEVRQGFARTVVAGSVQVEQGGIRMAVANQVTLGRQSVAGIVVARSVDGPGRVLVDWRGALVVAATLVALRFLGAQGSRRRGAGG
ncbi:MAG: hypothetical protein C4343_02710, partial [Chloroflexota bacterium]